MPSHFTDADVEVQRGWVTWLLSSKGLRWDEGPICAQPQPPVSQQASSLMPVPPVPAGPARFSMGAGGCEWTAWFQRKVEDFALMGALRLLGK